MNLEVILDAAELISLALTPATIIGAASVVFFWVPRCLRGKRDINNAMDCIMLGVAVSFFGAFFDNAFWGVAWADAHSKSHSGSFLFSIGVLFNVPFRQAAGSVAAYLHLRAFCIGGDTVERDLARLHLGSKIALLLGVAYVLLLEMS